MSDSSIRRPSFPERSRRTSRAAVNRATTTDTELWSVLVRAANSPSDWAGASASFCRTNSWAADNPTAFSAARDATRRSWTMRRTTAGGSFTEAIVKEMQALQG